MDSTVKHPVDQTLPLGKAFMLGLQHVLVMYAGAITVPLLIGRELKLEPAQIAFLVSSGLFSCGLVTVLQCLGIFKGFGIKLPIMMGLTFAAVGPLLAFASKNPGIPGLLSILGAVMSAGLLGFFIAPELSRVIKFFPPIVSGCIILVIGISLMRVGVGWVMGGPASSSQVVDVSKLVTVVEKYRSEQDAYEKGKENLSNIATNDASVLAKPPPKMAPIPMMDRPGYAAISNMMISLFVLVFIVLVLKFFKGFVANIAVLLGIVAGMVVSAINGTLNLTKVFEADAIGVINLFNFGAPTLDPFLIITVSLVMVVVFVESAGMYVAVSDITHKKISNHELSSGLRVNGFGTFLGGMLNTFPFTSFSQNVGLVEVTRVYSRWVCVVGGLILMFLGLLPKMGALVESIPQFVLGGAGVVMFGMVAASGIRILSTVDFATNRFNLYIMAISVGMGLIPLIAPRWTQHLPSVLQPILDSGILLAAIVSIFLNLLFNGLQTSDENLGLPEKIQDHF